MEWLSGPWPWYVTGPLIGLFVPILLLLGNRLLGVSSGLRAICAATLPSRAEFFRYDWRHSASWNLAFVAGIAIGGFLIARISPVPTPAISPDTARDIAALGVESVRGLAPPEFFSWSALLTLRGAIVMVVGGFLVGFGAAYAGGCTSGHGVTGLATLQPASLLATVSFFAGGLVGTFLILPLLA